MPNDACDLLLRIAARMQALVAARDWDGMATLEARLHKLLATRGMQWSTREQAALRRVHDVWLTRVAALHEHVQTLGTTLQSARDNRRGLLAYGMNAVYEEHSA